ncbi:hypothetical protein PVAP13_8KG399201 [Panicum virgatum]|uniref:Reverse transcriptase zinc-binding domain-containing protein n=1 Tax=Panicum virgatum TaxID=38727 RepID=A0A8T0PQH9_PANVG|nr:hypothetical protein PVAP13_8KG399201 [Panicum virgatum]
MSTILFSKSFLHKITTIIRKFWWTGIQEDNPTNPIPFRSWNDICQSKDNGGLGIKDLETVNKSLIIQAAYNIATEKSPILTSVLKSKYFSNKSFWTANNNGPKSIFWSSILQVKKELHNNVIFQIQVGNSSIWSSPSCPIWEDIHNHLLLQVTTNPLPSKVSDLWMPHSHNWDNNLLIQTFDNTAVNEIIKLHPVPNTDQDILRWKPANNGTCTTKAIYNHLASNQIINLPSQGSRSITPQTNQILKRAWKMKNLPPIIKTFAWRLIRRALPTAERASRYSTQPDYNCAACGNIENDAHLFFQCHLPRAVWFSSSPSVITTNLPYEQDGVQLILEQVVMPLNLDDSKFATLLTTMWYIWKARNERKYLGKKWTPIQVSSIQGSNHLQQVFGNTIAYPASIHTEGQLPQTNSFRITQPALIEGIRCYTDASTSPDQPTQSYRHAGIGIFFLVPQIHNN